MQDRSIVCRVTIALLVAMAGLAHANDPPESKVVSKKATIELSRVSSGVVGTLNLGKIRADQAVECPFEIHNATDIEVRIVRLAPSCACTTLELNQAVLRPGATSEAGLVKLKPPKVRGQLNIATIQMFDAKDSQQAFGIIKVVANVERPFSIDSNSKAFTLSEDKKQTALVGIRVDAGIDVTQIQCTSHDQLMECQISRIVEGAEECTITSVGDRDKLLAARFSEIRVSYINNEHGWELNDTVRFEFFDGANVRLIPSVVTTEHNIASFAIFRRATFNVEALKCTTGNGDELKAKFSKRADWLVNVTVELPTERAGKTFFVTDGNFRVEIPLNN